MDANGGLSNSDVALLADRANDGMWGGGGGAFFWIFALLILAGGGGFGWGGNRGTVTEGDLAAGLNNQLAQTQLNNIAMETANNRYAMAQVVNEQTSTLLQQNNTNLINAIQGFNAVNMNMTNQTNALANQIQQLSAQMNSCCCEIKTQMLQDRLADKEAENVALKGIISNANQSQYILSQLGRFVAWTPSGTQASAAG